MIEGSLAEVCFVFDVVNFEIEEVLLDFSVLELARTIVAGSLADLLRELVRQTDK